jgi:hypothetical protein
MICDIHSDLDLHFYPSRIPDPGVKNAPDPGSRIQIRNTAQQTHKLFAQFPGLVDILVGQLDSPWDNLRKATAHLFRDGNISLNIREAAVSKNEAFMDRRRLSPHRYRTLRDIQNEMSVVLDCSLILRVHLVLTFYKISLPWKELTMFYADFIF